MSRIHLFEFEDLSWFPSFLRNYGTDFLQFMSNKLKIYQAIVPILKKGIEQSGQDQIVDLGSGGGGGWLWLNEQLRNDIPNLKILLTDYYPNASAFEYTRKQADNFEYVDRSVDARNVPSELKGIRTLFLVLHHFRPADAQQILQNAVDTGSGIAVFEAQERSLAAFIGMLVSPISVLVTTPFIRPFKWGRILFTYIIPLVPLLTLWDGMVSALRTYSVKEMNELVAKLDHYDTFDWEIGKVKSGPATILYLLGTKK